MLSNLLSNLVVGDACVVVVDVGERRSRRFGTVAGVCQLEDPEARTVVIVRLDPYDCFFSHDRKAFVRLLVCDPSTVHNPADYWSPEQRPKLG